RADGEVLGRVVSARRVPQLLAGVAVQRRDIRYVAAVAIENDLVVHDDRRAAVAVSRSKSQVGVAPQDLAVPVEARRALMAKVNIELAVVDHRRGASMAVLGMNGRRGLAVLAKDLFLPQKLA